MLARDQPRQVSPLLLFAAVQLDLVHAQVRMRAVAQRDAGRGAGDLLDRDHMGDIAHVGPAIGFGHRDPQQAQLSHLLPQRIGKRVAAVDSGRHRLNPVLRPAVHHFAQGVRVLSQIELHHRVEHSPCSRFRHLLNTCSFYTFRRWCPSIPPSRQIGILVFWPVAAGSIPAKYPSRHRVSGPARPPPLPPG